MQISRLQEKSLFKKLIDPVCLAFIASQGYYLSEDIHRQTVYY